MRGGVLSLRVIVGVSRSRRRVASLSPHSDPPRITQAHSKIHVMPLDSERPTLHGRPCMYHAFPASTRTSQPPSPCRHQLRRRPPLLAVIDTFTAQMSLPACEPGQGESAHRLAVHAHVKSHHTHPLSLDSARPTTVSSAPTEPRSMPNPTTPVPPAPVASRRQAAQHSSFACARADTTHTHTPQRLAPALRLSIIDSNSERLATSGAATTPSSGTPGPSLRHTYRVGVHSSRP
ncbi:hypothetical protein C8R45DRAFT_118788 [Mycena sanguinolenta]|nr:hypothetical protein C8R45DRAFT_118788 [Mycena sanguinolenta]